MNGGRARFRAAPAIHPCAGDYVQARWLMLQQDVIEDYLQSE
jgi:hypothetical protein